MNDDWRFKQDFKGTTSDIRYVEWKYFSFKSETISGFFCYSIGNPRDILGLRKGIITYGIYFKIKYDRDKGKKTPLLYILSTNEDDLKLDLKVKRTYSRLLDLKIYNIIPLLKLNLLGCRYRLIGKVDDSEFHVGGTFDAEYPLKNII